MAEATVSGTTTKAPQGVLSFDPDRRAVAFDVTLEIEAIAGSLQLMSSGGEVDARLTRGHGIRLETLASALMSLAQDPTVDWQDIKDRIHGPAVSRAHGAVESDGGQHHD
jgi:hypothetical protein